MYSHYLTNWEIPKAAPQQRHQVDTHKQACRISWTGSVLGDHRPALFTCFYQEFTQSQFLPPCGGLHYASLIFFVPRLGAQAHPIGHVQIDLKLIRNHTFHYYKENMQIDPSYV